MQVARVIHQQMTEANAGGDIPETGAVQAPDVFREELARAAEAAVRTKKGAKNVSKRMKRLSEWAYARRKDKSDTGRVSQSEDSTGSFNPFATPTATEKKTKARESMESVSTPVSGVAPRVQTPTMTGTQPLRMSAVLPVVVSKRKVWSGPVRKRTIIKPSTIAGAGEGLFLMGNAKHNERVACYSGVQLTARQAEISTSHYILKISGNVSIDAEGEECHEGRKIN